MADLSADAAFLHWKLLYDELSILAMGPADAADYVPEPIGKQCGTW
jgi:hypothetical protein